jgi:uncharacterized repeat protein (TIGR01451 family)
MNPNFLVEPPDSSGAAGPNGILASVNERIAYFDKTGSYIWGPIDHPVFFAPGGGVTSDFLGDPHTLYDPVTGHFYTVVLEINFASNQSHFNIAVSKTSNPTTSGTADWYFYRFDDVETLNGNPYWTDYPGMGIDGQAVYVTYNMYGFTAGFANTAIIVLDKAGLNSGTLNFSTVYCNGATLQPCTVLGTNTPGNVAYFGEVLGPFVDSSHVRLWALSDPLGARTLTSTMITVPDNGGPPPFSGAPQPGTGFTIDTLDGRTEGNAFWHNGTVWFCHTAGGATGKSLVYYYAVNANGYPTGTPTLAEEGSIDGGPGEWTYQPNIGGNSRGDVAIVYDQSSATRNPTIFAATRIASAGAFDTPVLIKASPSFYYGGRWGDFASTTADPVDDSFWVTHEWARSSQVVDWGTWWANITPRTAPQFVLVTNLFLGGNGNGLVDPNECNNVFLVLSNTGSLAATHIQATLIATNAEVAIAQAASTYPDLPVNSSGTNFVAFKLSTSSLFTCGAPVDFSLVLKCDQLTTTNQFRIFTGAAATPLRFDNSAPVPITDADPIGTNSALVVSGFASAIKKAVVSLNISHTFDSDLVFQLISPAGVTNNLSVHNGNAGINFGAACSPDANRTTFDDDAVLAISGGFAPFVGPYRPDQPLSVFAGTSGTNVNGTWLLHVADTVGGDVGTLNCWSLILTPATCTDGGGECPGADLALGMTGNPEPVTVGDNLTYSISVTNNGASSAKTVNISQLLPNSVNFVSASASQGSVSQSGGVVTASLGRLSPRGRASVSVTVQPIQTGTISSTASASSEQQDFNQNNNSATVVSHVNPVSSDVAVGLSAPAAALLSDSLTYTVLVTNNGPSAASGVIVTNFLPGSVANVSATISQGSVSVLGNVVVCSFNTLGAGARASASIQCSPTAEGNITASAVIVANQPDPVQGNNTASVSTVIGPAADLAISLVSVPNPVVQQGQLTYKMVITNQGPSDATAIALTGILPAGLTFVSNYFTLDTLTVSGTSLSGTLASLPKRSSAIALLIVNATVPSGPMTATVSVSASQSDPNAANNTASVSTLVSPPFISIAPSAASLIIESGPTNGAIDLGETVTVSLSLANVGNVRTTNTTATLLAGNGVTPVGNTVQNYGSLSPSGIPGSIIARAFSFTASGTYGGSVVATLHVQDAGGYSTNVTFTFALPRLYTFSNTNRIDLPSTSQDQLQPGPAAPYPSAIAVSGVSGLVSKATVTLSNLNHTFPNDINLLLVGPTALKTVLMSDAAYGSSAEAVDLIFDDTASAPLPASGDISSGAWQPSVYDAAPAFSSPAPASPYGNALSHFNGADPNGAWSLFANDDAVGDFGNIAGGWSLSLTTVTPINQVADVGVSVTAAPGSARVGDNLTYTFTVTNAGPAAASVVMFTNLVPAGATLISASSSQGAAVTSGNLVAVSLGTLNTGVVATVTVLVTPTAAGSLANTGSVSANQKDLHAADNTASITTLVAASVADLGISLSGPTNSVIVGSNVTYLVTVTNNGPNSAINAVVTDSLPAALGSGTCSLPPVNWTNQSGTLSCSLGSLAPGASSTFSISATALSAGTTTNTATIAASGSSDTNAANNSASATVVLANPAPIILAAGSRLVSEDLNPNGAVDPGERVTVSFTLTNAGLLNASNLVASLQTSGGVTLPDPAQSYGLLTHGGVAVARNFAFTAANPVTGGAVTATLQLTNGTQYLGAVSFTFYTPSTTTFASSAPIIIPDHGSATPYPASTNVSGLTGIVSKVTLSLNGLTHSFPSDVNVLLVSPAGTTALLMSHSGAGHAVTNVNLTFDDAAAGALPLSGQITSGSYRPSAYNGAVTFTGTAPRPPYGTTLGALSGASPNGVWSLYVLDDAVGDSGSIASGWTLTITTIQTANPLADLAVTMTGSPNSLYTLASLTYSIAVSNQGPATATGVVLTDLLPSGVRLLAATSPLGAGVPSTGAVAFTIGQLPVHGTATATVIVQPTNSLTVALLNIATATLNETDLGFANNTARVITTVSNTPAILFARRLNPQLELTLSARPGLAYHLQSATLLTGTNCPTCWTNLLTTNIPSGGLVKFITTDATNAPRRYYRAARIIP